MLRDYSVSAPEKAAGGLRLFTKLYDIQKVGISFILSVAEGNPARNGFSFK
jgi:hypothetical protein